MLVDNLENSNIVSVVDWEWASIVPAQLSQSPSQSLMIRKPDEWSNCDVDEFDRYNHLLKLYLDEMERLETSKNTSSEDSLSRLMRQSMADGKFWLHVLIDSCYSADYSAPWKALQKMIPNIDKLGCLPDPYRRAFVDEKFEDLATYKTSLEAMQAQREIEKKRKERELVDIICRVLAEEPDNALARQKSIII